MNQVTLSGRIVRDPVRRETQTGIAVCNFTIAVMRPGTKKEDRISDFIDCVIWRGGADAVSKYFHKGDGITVSGHIQNREWTDKDGNKRTGTEIMVNEFEFPLARKAQEQNAQEPAPEQAKPETYVEADEPLPF